MRLSPLPILTMRHAFAAALLAAGFSLSLPVSAASLAAPADTAAAGVLGQLPKARHPAAWLWTSGQPAAGQFAQLKAAGIERVINLRPRDEAPDFDEAAAAERAGLIYRNLPIAGPQDLTLANAKALDAMLADGGSETTLMHCASGNRVGALMSLRAAWLHGRSVTEALAIGRAHGLTSLEAAVVQKLAEHRRN